MKDLDFDELDRAVNSLQVAPPLSAAPAVSDPAMGEAISVTVNTSSSRPAPLAERRSSGRFMDVVHPSSDMRSSIPLVTPAPSTEAEAPQPASETSAPVASTVAAPSETNMPDPIDFHPFTPGAMAASPTQPVAQIENTDVAQIASDTSTPLESPFLSDAKVEKRPLGAFSTDMHTSPLQVTSSPEPAPSVSDEVSPGSEINTVVEPVDLPIENDTPLPAELQDNLLSIEANEDAHVPSPVAQFTTPTAPSTDVPIGPTSIPQQYSEQPSTGDQPASTIFDTEAYKKPAPAAKKKSSWMIIVWILLLLVVGGGIGAAVYFFVLPHL